MTHLRMMHQHQQPKQIERECKLRFDWVVGRPGAGKTTALSRIFKRWPNARDEKITAADMPPDIPGVRTASVWVRRFGEDTVVLGVYDRKRVGKKVRLRGPDCYTPLERTRIKFIVEWLAKYRADVKYVLAEGLPIANKPFIATVKKHTSLRAIVIDTPRDVSDDRFWKRNREMVDNGQLHHMPNDKALRRSDAVIDRVIDAADCVLRCSQDEAVEAVVAARAAATA